MRLTQGICFLTLDLQLELVNRAGRLRHMIPFFAYPPEVRKMIGVFTETREK
jgi:hypothetical protein